MSSAAARPKAILPWWQLALLLAACAAGVWFLLPDDSTLIENLLRDGRPQDARRQLGKLTTAERARNPAYFRLLEVRATRLELPPNNSAALVHFWQEATTAWRETEYSGPIFLEFYPLVPRLADQAAAWSMVVADIARAPAGQRIRLTADFTSAALAANLPAFAAGVFALGHPAAKRTPDESIELSRLWQLAGRTVDALAALGEVDMPAVVTRRIALLRELNRNREALALLRARADVAPPDLTLAGELSIVAQAAGDPIAAVPYFERYVAANPRDLVAQRRLRTLLLAAGQPAAAFSTAQQAVNLSAHDSADLRELARISEFAGQPVAAFDAWLEFALDDAGPASERLAALDRLIALNPGLYRDVDLARALAKLSPISGRPDDTLRLARLYVGLGRFDEARAAFEKYLSAVPSDATALVEFAHLHYELYRFADAEVLLRRAVALRPTDSVLRREIAENLVLQNRSTDALALYRQLAQATDTEEIIGPYIRLAESLGRYDDFTRGLRRRIDRSPTPEARDYLLLAYGYELADDPARRKATLEEGLRRTTPGDDLRLQLAFALSAEWKYAAAQTVLEPHQSLHSDSAAATLYLELLRLNNDTEAERRYLAVPLAPALIHDEPIIERRAHLHEALRDYSEAEQLWRELHNLRPTELNYTAGLARLLLIRGRNAEANQLLAPFLREPTPAILKLAAEIAESAGDHRAAEKYQLTYLATVGTAVAGDWRDLGDIRLSRGDRIGAKRAYAEALRRLQFEIASAEGKE